MLMANLFVDIDDRYGYGQAMKGGKEISAGGMDGHSKVCHAIHWIKQYRCGKRQLKIRNHKKKLPYLFFYDTLGRV
jgi:hypothetical protein